MLLDGCFSCSPVGGSLSSVGSGIRFDLLHDPPGGGPVKLIIAIIQPNRLESVKQALSEVEVFRLTVLDVQGFGRQRGHAETYRGHEIAVNLLRKVQLQIAVNDDFVEPTIAAIVKGGRSGERGEIGDGKIFVLPMDECVRIRTGERGREAI
jgi:nitrogen regulatory protein P-II 2